MNLEQARAILHKDGDRTPPSVTIEAIATVLRFHGLADKRIAKIATDLDSVAESQAAHEPEHDRG